jgi:lysophospholipase L1-like esterase
MRMRMRVRVLAGVAAAAAAVLPVAGAASASASAPGAAAAERGHPGYAALGDSYSAGVGAGARLPGSGGCERSSGAFPELWAAAHPASPFAFAACLGATTRSVQGSQLGVLRPDTGLVSLTVGGNDAGFADTLQSCVLRGHAACRRSVAAADEVIDRQLPGRLDELYRRIRAAAPSARVVVLGYPRLYHRPGDCPFGLSDASRVELNAAADRLDRVLAAAARRAGFQYADVRAAFAGHELCSGQPWLRSVAFPLDDSYHPTAAGQSGGYLPVLTGAAG